MIEVMLAINTVMAFITAIHIFKALDRQQYGWALCFFFFAVSNTYSVYINLK